MIKQGTGGLGKGRATEISREGGGGGGGEGGENNQRDTSLEYSCSLPGARFSKVSVTYRARKVVLFSFRRRVERGLKIIQ